MSAAQRLLEKTQNGTAVRVPAVAKRFAKSARRASVPVKCQKTSVPTVASRPASAASFSPINVKNKRNVSVAAVAASGAKSSTLSKTVYLFGKDISEGNASMRLLLGGKGANLAEMANLGINVPPGFTITTDTCAEFHVNGCQLPPGCWEDVLKAVKVVEKATGFSFGSSDRPLLLSVRSGAAVSMPGMMDTVLNLGNNDTVVEAMAAKAGARFAYDSYRRFLEMFGNVVMGIDRNLFEKQLHHMKVERGVEEDTELTADDMKLLVARFKDVYRAQGMEFPQDPYEQLKYAIYAVFDSWNSERAIVYRQVSGIAGYKGTAVNVQAMVFGNMGETSGTGVCFTRDPKSGSVMTTKGKRDIWGEYLVNAQGEDVVAGIRTPSPISVMAEELPQAHTALVDSCVLLENHFKDMQDVEFTVQEGQLYILQCRGGKRAGRAAVQIATDLANEGIIDKATAVMMVEAGHLDELLLPQFEDVKAYKKDVMGKGLDASPGAAVGQAVFSAAKAEEWKAAGLKVVLIRKETSPEDVKGMYISEGVLTALGGQTSHAAVVARGWGKPCVSGCKELQVDEEKGIATLNGHVVHEGNWISINGGTGEIIKGKQPLRPADLSADAVTFLKWVDEYRQMKVLTNADTPKDAMTARNFGAEGIGLVRTEHMFFESADRIKKMRRMIVAPTPQARKAALESMLEFQRKDFEGIFTAMDGFPVTIRLLDPPLHEFMQENEINEICAEMSKEYGLPAEKVLETVDALHETNPMLGFRGCRLGIAYPDITEMQARAIFEAAVNVAKKGVKVQPDVMVPLVGTLDELKHQSAILRRVAGEVFKKTGTTVPYRVGTMIEVPRAALIADEIAEEAEFFSFGTNDLTQMTFGYSRDDSGKFVPLYIKQGILPSDPFQELDVQGVGKLIKMATQAGRTTRPDLKVGLCGEQGGHPKSVQFLAEVGLDYVSCSPFRVPGARLAAAQAAIKKTKASKK